LQSADPTQKVRVLMTETFTDARARLERTPGVSWVQRLVRHIQQDDVLGLSAEIAYHWIFAIPPLMILVVMSGAMLDSVTDVDVVGQLRTQIEDRAPADMASVLNGVVDNAVAEVGGGIASLGVITAAAIALWSGSNGMGALMKAFNRAYVVEEGRPYVRKRLVAVGLTVMLIGLLNAAFLLLMYGERIGRWLANSIGAGEVFEKVWDVSRWPMALVAIVVVLGLLYLIAPNVDQSFKWVAPGTIVATLLWLVLVLGFGLYLQFSDPGSAYGVLGGMIVLLFFLYLTAAVLLIGGEINAVVHEQQKASSRKPV